MKLSVKFFSSLYLALVCTSASSNLLAAQIDKPERWFEIEVILFQQLGDKKLLKEKFPENINSTSLPQYTKYFDILTSYIQPNLTDIKQFMPLCSDQDARVTFLKSIEQINIPFLDTIKEIEYTSTFNIPNLATDTDTDEDLFILKEQNLILQKELTNPLFSTKNICIISHNDFENILSNEQLTTFKLDAFDIKALPKKLNASGFHNPNTPYIIANESLLLTDINQRLQWSKEFKPLLHFGWRQIGITQDEAIPFKLFAGKHLDSQYKKDLNNYHSALNEAKQTEKLILIKSDNNTQTNTSKTANTVAQQKKNVEIKKQQLTELFSDVNVINNDNINSLINKLEQETFKDVIVNDEVTINNKPLKINKPPVAPLQDWFLDGFIKVHLDHYLYITVDFNILSETSDEITTSSFNQSTKKLINFSQNKRVITGEIHYLDHPYIGMIIQIRRFDPSKSKEEAVTQVIN